MRFNRIIAATALSIGVLGPLTAFAAVAPPLATMRPFGVLSTTFTNSNTPPQTILNGDVCYTTGPTTVPLTINGVTSTPCGAQTGLDQSAALAIINDQVCTDIGPGEISLDTTQIGSNPPGTFPPGCYSTDGAMDISGNATVTLDGPGVYIFRAGGALNTGANSLVVATNGANPNDVFWAPVGAATLGANGVPFTPILAQGERSAPRGVFASFNLSGGTRAIALGPTGPPLPTPTFIGNIIDPAGITLGHFVILLGRLLAFGGTVTTDANTISVPPSDATLHLIKVVVNTGGGAGIASDFSLHVKNAGTDVVGSPAVGVSAPGTMYSLPSGAYTVSEDANGAYVRTFTGDCDAAGNITLSSGDDMICTVVNTDIPPPPAPVVTPTFSGANGGGGGGVIVPLIGILKVPTPLALPAGPASVTYNYTVFNVGGIQSLDTVKVTDDKCAPVTFLSGDDNGNGKLDASERWLYSCTTTLAQTTSNTAVATAFGDDSNRTSAIATAIATVVVGSAPVPGLPNTGVAAPLINIVKVPSRLTPFPFGGGPVTYTYTVTNPGVLSMSNVTVTDNTCPIVSRTGGDGNGNGLLDPGEAWIYSCSTNVPVSTRNVATARGSANGFTAVGFAFATVLVAAPGLPNTGFPPEGAGGAWDMITVAGVFLVLSGLWYRRYKNRTR